MTFLHRYEQALACRTDLAIRDQGHLDLRSPLTQLDHFPCDEEFGTERRRPSQFDAVSRSDSARRLVVSSSIHQSDSRRPIAMTIHQSTDYSTVDHPWKCLVLWQGLKAHLKPVLAPERTNSQAFGVGRSTTETDALGSVGLLHRCPTWITHRTGHRRRRLQRFRQFRVRLPQARSPESSYYARITALSLGGFLERLRPPFKAG